MTDPALPAAAPEESAPREPDHQEPEHRAPENREPQTKPDAAQASQSQITQEIDQQHREHAAAVQAGRAAETQPRIDFAPYRSSILRHPTKSLHHADPETIELFSPAFGHRDVGALESDLTIQANGEPIGERIKISGRVVDADGHPVAGQLIEVWQANAAGRYMHKRDQHPAPLDPNFTGVGRTITGPGGEYEFITIKPGPYPWKNHFNAWRPAHVHFSLFGTDFTQRMITQMYFPSDPLFALDPIYQSIRDQKARDMLVASYDHDLSEHEWIMGYRWDIVLTGSNRTWMEAEDHE